MQDLKKIGLIIIAVIAGNWIYGKFIAKTI